MYQSIGDIIHFFNLGELLVKYVAARLRERVWEFLQATPELNGFEDQEEFEAAFSELEQPEGAGVWAFVCRKRTNRPFDSNNMRLINVSCDASFSSVTEPAIRGESLQ
ncbi:hypothetical protein [Rubinisphaera sp. JC750]|uniref:hypothetical protein n=1 Tax=Rubinisphaera sp. JC750 TaxID=2898658 RepID=UPI001F27E75C|nr:hypothetical protein [Rubinisphaera sp. JC750]